MSCQGCRVTTSDLKIFQSDDMTITLIIISNKINYVFFKLTFIYLLFYFLFYFIFKLYIIVLVFSLSLCIHHIAIALRVGIICLVPIQWFCMKEESLS